MRDVLIVISTTLASLFLSAVSVFWIDWALDGWVWLQLAGATLGVFGVGWAWMLIFSWLDEHLPYF